MSSLNKEHSFYSRSDDDNKNIRNDYNENECKDKERGCNGNPSSHNNHDYDIFNNRNNKVPVETINLLDWDKLDLLDNCIADNDMFLNWCNTSIRSKNKNRRSTKKVYVGPFFLHMLSEQQKSIFYESICDLSRLEELYIACYWRGGGGRGVGGGILGGGHRGIVQQVVPAVALAPALSRAVDTLVSLQLNCPALVDSVSLDTMNSNQEFSESLAKLKLLKRFEWVGMIETTNLDEIAHTLATLPCLESVCLGPPNGDTVGHASSLVSSDALGALCQSKTLQKLKLENLGLNDWHIKKLANSLQTISKNASTTHMDYTTGNANTSLWYIHIEGENNNLGDTSVIAIANVLRSRDSTIKHLSISLDGLSDKGVIALAEALSSPCQGRAAHQHLQSLSIKQNFNTLFAEYDNDNSNNMQSNLAFAIGDAGYDSLIRMLEKNVTLKEFELSIINSTGIHNSLAPALLADNDNKAHLFRMKKDMYLKLNRMGRQGLFRRHYCQQKKVLPAPAAEGGDVAVNLIGDKHRDDEDYDTQLLWIECLERCNDDLDCLFYFLQANPSFFC